jgi:hypothetical protein
VPVRAASPVAAAAVASFLAAAAPMSLLSVGFFGVHEGGDDPVPTPNPPNAGPLPLPEDTALWTTTVRVTLVTFRPPSSVFL